MIDIFLGWTVIGWVVALAMAVRTVPANATRFGVITVSAAVPLETTAPAGPLARGQIALGWNTEGARQHNNA